MWIHGFEGVCNSKDEQIFMYPTVLYYTMPKKGYESVTLTEQVYNIATKNAVKEKRSTANYVSKLILEDRQKEKNV